MTNPGYLLGRAVGYVACLLARPVAPFAESALAGVLDGLFGEPDELDVSYTPTPSPRRPTSVAEFGAALKDVWADPLVDHERHVRAYDEWLESVNGARITHYHFDEVDPAEYDPTWTLDRDRIDEIRGDAA